MSAVALAEAAREQCFTSAQARIGCAHFAAGQIVSVEYFGGHYFKCAAKREHLSNPDRSAVYPQHHLTGFSI